MLAVQSAPLTAPSAHDGASLCRRRRGRACRPVAALTFRNVEVSVDTHKAALEYGVGCVDITPLVRDAAAASGIKNGLVTVISKHTTTAVCVNENESRLFTDIQARRTALLCVALGFRVLATRLLTLQLPPAARRFCFSLHPRCLKHGTDTTILSSGASARPCGTVCSDSSVSPCACVQRTAAQLEGRRGGVESAGANQCARAPCFHARGLERIAPSRRWCPPNRHLAKPAAAGA